jgi:biotin transport system substrate-specific component
MQGLDTQKSVEAHCLFPKICYDILYVFGASCLLSLVAQIKIPLFFTPVPLVLQNSLAVVLGLVLGPRKGALAVALYLVYGCFGLPVFAGGQHFGLSVLLSPFSGGYLIGYCAASFTAGKIREHFPTWTFFPVLVGHLIILTLGTAFLAFTMGWEQAFLLGFLPFFIPDLVKSFFIFLMLHRHI